MKNRILVIGMAVTLLLLVAAYGGSTSNHFLPGGGEQAISALQEPPTFNIEFDSEPDGFGFRNYSKQFPEGDLTISEVRDMFGDQICKRIDSGRCIPFPEAKKWQSKMNKYMNQMGHCVGFTAMSNRLYDGQFETATFTPDVDITYDIAQNITIMRRIAQNWTMQVTDEIAQATVQGTPKEIIDALLTMDEPVDLGIFNRKGAGHSMLAYGVEDKGDDIYWILVYDNNWPGQELYVEVDYDANTWRYSLAAMNPDEDKNVWEGDANSEYQTIFVPMSAYDEEMSCPKSLCGKIEKASATDARGTVVSLTGGGDFLVRDEQWQYIGLWANTLVNNVSAGQLTPLKGALSGKGIYVTMPEEEDLTIQTGNTGSTEKMGDLWAISPGFSMSVDGLHLRANRQDELFYSAADQKTSFTTFSAQRPVFKLGLTQNDISYLFVLADIKFNPFKNSSSCPSCNLSMDVDENNGLVITSQGVAEDNIKLVIARLDSAGESIFAGNNLSLQEGETIALDFANWNGQEPLGVSIDTDGDGTFEPQAPLTNQFPEIPLRGLETADEIIMLLDETAAYMSRTDIDNLLDTLTTLDLDGDDYCRVLSAFEEFELTEEQLTTFLNKLNLPPEDLGECLFELRQNEESRDGLINALGLSSAAQVTVLDELTSMEEVRQVLNDVDFLSLESENKVEALPSFLVEQGLDTKQAGNALERIVGAGVWSESEIDTLLAKMDLPDAAQETIRNDLAGVPLHPSDLEQCLPAEPALEASASPAKTPAATPTPSPSASTLPAPDGLLTFETFGTWQRGDQPYGTFTQKSTPVKEGSNAGCLAYDFTAAAAADDFVLFEQKINIDGEPNLINAWVNGDGSEALFNIWILDAKNEMWSIAMDTVAHEGWQEAVGIIDPDQPWPTGHVYGPDNGIIDYPIRFNALVLDRTSGPATGQICFDDITFSRGTAPTPTATATPSATTTQTTASSPSVIKFEAGRTEIKQCECTELSWQTENVQAVYYQGQGQVGVGSKQECPWETSVYTLQVFKADGTEEVEQITVNVEPDPSCVPTPTPLPPPPPRNDNDNDNSNRNSNSNDNRNSNSNNNSSNSNSNGNSSSDPYPSPSPYPNDNSSGNSNDNSSS